MTKDEVLRRAKKELQVAERNYQCRIGKKLSDGEIENLRLKVEYRKAVLDALEGE